MWEPSQELHDLGFASSVEDSQVKLRNDKSDKVGDKAGGSRVYLETLLVVMRKEEVIG